MTKTANVIELRQTMSVAEVIEQLVQTHNKEANEFDSLVDEVEDLRDQAAQTKRFLETYKQAIESKNKTLEDAAKAIESLQSHAQKQELKIASLEIDAKSAKANATENKRLKEQNQRLKERNSELLKHKETSIRDIRQYRNEQQRLNVLLSQAKITSIYAEDGEHLMILPFMNSVSVEQDKQGSQLTLLYSDGCGIWRQVAIDSNKDVGFGMLNFKEDTPQRTKDLAMKFLCSPSEKVKDIAEAWLRKVNIKQNGAVTPADLNLKLLER
jgi:myosin heavy subunit